MLPSWMHVYTSVKLDALFTSQSTPLPSPAVIPCMPAGVEGHDGPAHEGVLTLCAVNCCAGNLVFRCAVPERHSSWSLMEGGALFLTFLLCCRLRLMQVSPYPFASKLD
eukprot:1159547-Pelagomonas_calceolata.AAC.8